MNFPKQHEQKARPCVAGATPKGPLALAQLRRMMASKAKHNPANRRRTARFVPVAMYLAPEHERISARRL
jgi:hypothetical protein